MMNQMNQMNQFYQPHSPLMPIRRATEPVTLAPAASMIDPSLENHRLQNVQLGAGGYGNSTRMQMQGQQLQNQLQQQTQQLQQNQMQQNQLQNPMTVPNQSNGGLQNRQSNGARTPTFQRTSNGLPERTLPGKKVDDDCIEDAFVQFVLFCNPTIPMDVDTTELRKGFRAPPKSDGKSFSPFHLYQLIARLENKEIKTWTELVIELGVSPPDVAKNQSSQKVQQYAVRLKRWLHAFHVDAFFKYLQNIPNTYLSERPMSESTQVEREGIPPEEDLTLRALLPEWRPKRGRRKAEDIEAEDEVNVANKRHNRSSSTDFTSMFEEQYSAAPSSAMAWSAQPQQADPWAAAQVALAPSVANASQTPSSSQTSGQHHQQARYRFNNNSEAPSSPYPQSAITPRQAFSASPSINEPRSAHPSTSTTKSSPPSRNRRRHTPAVSSAWPSTTGTASGKLRGRPPSNRSVQDGPFSTFPVNPNTKDSPASVNISNQSQNSPSPSREATPSTQTGGITFTQTPTLSNPSLPKKPSKLQLQVPEHAGGPVRLATPPRVLINGESNGNGNGGQGGRQGQESRSSAEFFNQLYEASEEDERDGREGEEGDEEGRVDWRRRALVLKRRLAEKEEELRAMKRRVLDAVM